MGRIRLATLVGSSQFGISFARRLTTLIGSVALLLAMVVGLSGVSFAQVSRDVEQWVLEQKWEQVRQALTADDVVANPVARLLSAYACLATGDYKIATDLCAKLGDADDVAKLMDYTSGLVQKHPTSPIAQMLKGDALARAGRYEEALAAFAAINEVTEIKPTFTGNSGGAEVIPRMAEMMARGDLPPEIAKRIGFNNLALTAYPFHQWQGGDVAIPEVLLKRIDGKVYNFHTTPGYWSNKLVPTEKVTNIQVTDSKGRGIPHGDFNNVMLLDGRPNPVLQIGGPALRGPEPSSSLRREQTAQTAYLPSV